MFNAAGNKLEERRTAKVARYGPMRPLKGKLECESCGPLLSPHSTRKGNKVYRYSRCRATAGGRPACGYQISAGHIENAVADRLPNSSRDDLLRRRIGELVEHAIYDPETRGIQIRWRSQEGVTVGYVW